jgi:hypothetical protein
MCLAQAGYKNTPWDPKLFFKWTAAEKPMIIIAYSDDFRWFGPEENLEEWDNAIKIFNNHGYQVTDATDKEFVGIKISRDEQFNYYMDQHRMIETILEEENINGTKDEHLCTIPQLDATTQTTIQAILIRSNGGGFPETEIYRDKTAILTAEKGENRKKTVYFF